MLDTLTVEGCGFSWRAVDANGQQHGRNYRHQYDAQRMADQLMRESKIKTRNCMCCTVEFQSEGPQHRMCIDCRKLSEVMG